MELVNLGWIRPRERAVHVKVRTLVVGYDGSDPARDAIHTAADIVANDGIVHIVTAYHPMSQADLGDLRRALPDEFQYSFDPIGEQGNLLAEAGLVLHDRGIEHDCHLVADDPATAILEIAEKVDADLIIVGSRGLGTMRRFIRGSVSVRVATHAPTSVMIVHAPVAA